MEKLNKYEILELARFGLIKMIGSSFSQLQYYIELEFDTGILDENLKVEDLIKKYKSICALQNKLYKKLKLYGCIRMGELEIIDFERKRKEIMEKWENGKNMD